MKPFRIFLLGFCTVVSLIGELRGQNIEQANAAYQQFVRLNNNGADRGEIYNTLYQCYQAYNAVICSEQNGTTAYTQALNGLKDIYPYLQNGAAYHSSNRQQQNALLFAQAYMDIPLMEAFRGATFPRDDNYAKMAYFAASGTYNAHDYAKAIPYFRVYLSTGDTKYRKDVYTFMAKAYSNLKDYAHAIAVYDEALISYSSDFNLLSMAINCCIDANDNDGLQRYVSKAIALRPTDNTLLNLQGKLYEDSQQYQKALNVYMQLRTANPRSLDVSKHIALNYYNLGAMHYNMAEMEQNEKNARRTQKQAQEYFTAAATTLTEVLNSDPASLKYLQALAATYKCLGKKEQMEEVNTKIAALGGQVVADDVTPTMLTFAGNAPVAALPPSAYTLQSLPTQSAAATYPTKSPVTEHTESPATELPIYSEFAKEYVENRLTQWQGKDPYETLDEYKQRVTEETRQAKIKELLASAEHEYIKTYTRNIKFNDLVLKPYDAENKVFLVESQYGELIIPVPRENNEARAFESCWNGMQFKNPAFYINNDRLTLSGLTFVTPTGKSYRYDGDKSLNYTETVVDVNFTPLDGDMFAANTATQKSTKHTKQALSVGSSDVDIDIPVTKGNNEHTFAVIISNEHYDMVTHVPMALNDGKTFSLYCERTLRLPANNIRYYGDASYGVMIRALRDIQEIATAYNGDISVIFYYAGHGIPNEATKDAYLLPVDADGSQTEGCYSLKRLYGELGALNARAVYVFLDACFSGAKRDGGMLASARGVALKSKKEDPQGNMVIFSAASDDETAFPYQEKGHGLFTYYLLKKLQESKGNVTLSELGNYVTTQVKQQSVVVNRKTQTPTVTPSASLADTWRNLKLKP